MRRGGRLCCPTILCGGVHKLGDNVPRAATGGPTVPSNTFAVNIRLFGDAEYAAEGSWLCTTALCCALFLYLGDSRCFDAHPWWGLPARWYAPWWGLPCGGWAPGVLIRNLGRSSWRFDTQPWGRGPSDLDNAKIKLLKDANNLGRPSSSVLARAARRPSSSSSCQSGVGVLLSKLIRKPSLILSLEVPLGSRVGRKSTSDLPEAPHSRCSLLRILPRRVQRESSSRHPPSFCGSRRE